jgi:hypothetical protein
LGIGQAQRSDGARRDVAAGQAALVHKGNTLAWTRRQHTLLVAWAGGGGCSPNILLWWLGGGGTRRLATSAGRRRRWAWAEERQAVLGV